MLALSQASEDNIKLGKKTTQTKPAAAAAAAAVSQTAVAKGMRSWYADEPSIYAGGCPSVTTTAAARVQALRGSSRAPCIGGAWETS